jgi:hypothetical protein
MKFGLRTCHATGRGESLGAKHFGEIEYQYNSSIGTHMIRNKMPAF